MEDGGEGQGTPSQPASQPVEYRPRAAPAPSCVGWEGCRGRGGGQTEPCPLAVSSGATSPGPGAAPLWVCTVGSIIMPSFQLC